MSDLNPYDLRAGAYCLDRARDIVNFAGEVPYTPQNRDPLCLELAKLEVEFAKRHIARWEASLPKPA